MRRPHCRVLVAEWIHLTLFGDNTTHYTTKVYTFWDNTVLPTIQPKVYTFWDKTTHYNKTKSVRFLGLMNSATKVSRLTVLNLTSVPTRRLTLLEKSTYPIPTPTARERLTHDLIVIYSIQELIHDAIRTITAVPFLVDVVEVRPSTVSPKGFGIRSGLRGLGWFLRACLGYT